LLQDNYECDNDSYVYTNDFSDSCESTGNFPFEIRGEEEVSKIVSYIQALKEDRVEDVEEFCNKFLKKENIDKPFYEGINSLQFVVLFGNISTIKKLIEMRASPDVRLEKLPLIHLSLSFASMYNCLF